ncbi:hypothetical protein W97_00393 [Coniosporium apollinis CBS 100218]|uniref:Cytochrome P450 n=1 Tax=Coniosporium apollinis (strain CBS 100218) TaxID=1168221 RepID=R7YHS5_CONA1|nr:uncharacterized protein W97_00393 [Coniosporium apollinis CBS 100218]EON61181.1 hypothetical protein W97_00393 [Coniosporium apollinis CBS 100218]
MSSPSLTLSTLPTFLSTHIYLLPLAPLFTYMLYQLFFSPISPIPDPLPASLTRLWLTYQSWAGSMPQTILSLHRSHRPSELNVADLSAIKRIYGPGTKFRVAGASRVRLVCGDRRGGPWGAAAADVIGEVTFSRCFGLMDVGADDGSFKQIEGALRSAAWIGQVPWLYWAHGFLMPYIGNWLGITARHGSLRSFAMSEAESWKDRGTDRKDILSKLFVVQKEKPSEFNDNAVVSMATSNNFAGSDTTAISTRAIIYYLLKNPQYKRRLVDEIDDLRRQGKLGDPVKAGGSGQYAISAGYHIQSTPPESRSGWLKEDAGDIKRFFFALGSGARMCLGRNISWIKMSKLIPTLCMHYEWC